MQLFKRFLLIAFPLLLSVATHAMEDTNETSDALIEINELNSTSSNNNSWCCPWGVTNNNNEERELFINDNVSDNNCDDTRSTNPSEIARKVITSLLCRCKKEKQDIHHDLEDGVVSLTEYDADNNNTDTKKCACCSLTPAHLKIAGVNALEIAFKLGFAGFSNYYNGARDEVTFFAQHHAAEAIGKHIKFNTWRLPKYVLASAFVMGLGASASFLEFPLFHAYDTGALPIAWFTIFKMINNYFDQLNHDENHED